MLRIEVENFGVVSANAMRFVFEQAEKRLKSTLDMADRITVRAYAVLVLLVPCLSAVIGIFRNDLKGCTNAEWLLLMCCVVGLCVVLMLIVKIIYPRDMHQLGREPKVIALPEYYENPDYPHEESYVLLLTFEIEDYQSRIDYMEKQNSKRIYLLKWAYCVFVVLFFVLVLFVLFNWF
jgi:hypothetical protein